jgi:hypothetical protein
MGGQISEIQFGNVLSELCSGDIGVSKEIYIYFIRGYVLQQV